MGNKAKKNNKRKLLQIKIIKQPDKIELDVKVDRKIEKFFSKEGKSEEVSRVWKDARTGKGLEFYKPFEFRVYSDYYILNNFGSSELFFSNTNEVNIAVLRVVGLSKGKRIVLENAVISYSELQEWVEALCKIVERIYREYIVKVKIENVVNVILK